MKTFQLCLIWFVFTYTLMAQDRDAQYQSKDLKVNLKVVKGGKIEVSVTNITTKMLRLYSHVIADIKHYDYFEIEAYTPDYEHIYGISMAGDRDKSAPVIVELAPQKSFSHTIDLNYWLATPHNIQTLQRYAQLQTLPDKCGVKIRVKYRNSPCTDCNEYYKSIWTGYAYSEWVAW